MQRRRVVITGMGAMSPLGLDVNSLMDKLTEGISGVRLLSDFYPKHPLNTNVVALVPPVDFHYLPRHVKRSMSPMGLFAYRAAQEALSSLDPAHFSGDEMGLVAGSTIGSPNALEEFFTSYLKTGMDQIRTHTFFKIMSHTVMSNLAQALGISGHSISVSGACSTSAQAIGIAFDNIVLGRYDKALCGGADEYHLLVSGVFDILEATAQATDENYAAASKPFDKNRSGIVCAEGAGILLLESLDSAKARGASIFAEVIGFGSNMMTSNIAHPGKDEIMTCMALAIKDAGLEPRDITYVNAHATATYHGDCAEGQAIEALFGASTPISSLKGHMGHTMAASGALELIATVSMLNQGSIIPTLNLDNPDPACGDIYLLQKPLDIDQKKGWVAVKNSFALGGLNTSLVIRSYND